MKFDINSLSVEDLVGQVLCPSISAKNGPKEVEEMLKTKKPVSGKLCLLTRPEKGQTGLFMVT